MSNQRVNYLIGINRVGQLLMIYRHFTTAFFLYFSIVMMHRVFKKGKEQVNTLLLLVDTANHPAAAHRVSLLVACCQ